jgi:DNA-3-methyladenine glycosylase II
MDGPAATFELEYSPPLDWSFFLRFLGARATPGVESVQGDRYVRTIATGTFVGTVSVSHHPRDARLIVAYQGDGEPESQVIRTRMRRIFDLGVDLTTVHATLARDPFLGPLVAAAPGIRIPGAWCAFELLVRCIVGQQVTVKAATTIMGRIVSRLGTPLAGAGPGDPSFLFPTASALAEGNLGSIGMPSKRAIALQAVARAIADKTMPFPDRTRDTAGVREALIELPGIGPWTVEYFALRALGDADAWPGTDLILRRSVERFADADQTWQPLGRDRWRPYCGYAAMHLWNRAAQDQTRVVSD